LIPSSHGIHPVEEMLREALHMLKYVAIEERKPDKPG
jgi:hypothetical protein